jgi:hypothetical protein
MEGLCVIGLRWVDFTTFHLCIVCVGLRLFPFVSLVFLNPTSQCVVCQGLTFLKEIVILDMCICTKDVDMQCNYRRITI